ncbi:MAG TPA: RNA methyltransferase [Chitinophagaceae bacterium]|nr:RNA methyltransferase [Chitinophagaceae bacterium]
MLSKTQVKYIQSLFHKKFREEYGQFIVEGPKMAEEAITLSFSDIINIYACSDWIDRNISIDQNLKQKIVEVSVPEMEKISSLHTPSNVLIVLKKPLLKAPQAWDGLTLLLDGIQDPGNLGTMIRTADWFGVKHVVCGAGTADCYNPKVIQSTMGSIFRTSIFYEDLNSFLAQHSSVPLIVTSLDGEPLNRNEKWNTAFVVIGNESQGVQQSITSSATRKILIPRIGQAESLNAAVAAGIILYELTA